MRRARSLEGNIPKILILNSLWMFLVVMPVVVPFFGHHGLTMTQIYQLQAILALCVVLFEVPSGYLADLFGRRRSLILSGLFHGAGFTVLAMAQSFAGFALFEVLAALGNSFFSGSDVALLYDTEEALGKRSPGGRSLGRKLLWAQVGETIAAPIGGALALAGLHWPATINAAVAWLPIIVAWTLVEPPRARLTGSHRQQFTRILRIIFRTTAVLRLTMLALVAYGLATLLAVWAFQGYWAQLGLPLFYFGILWAAYNLSVALTGRFAHHLEERRGPQSLVITISLLPIVGYGGMALFAGDGWTPTVALVGGVLAGFAFQIGRGLNQVVIRDALNTRVPAELRATANSISSLGVRVLFVALGPLLGWAIDTQGYDVALSGFALGYLGVLFAIGLPLARAIQREQGATSDGSSDS